MLRNPIAGALALGLVACGGSGGGFADDVGRLLAMFDRLALADLQRADQIAIAGGDEVGHACFAYWLPIAERAEQASPGAQIGGAIALFERVRVARLALVGKGGGACGPLLKEEAEFAGAVATRAGLITSTGGGAGVLGFFGL